MPTRLIREGINTSEAVNKLSVKAEVFYRRLMSVVDDYGRFFSHPSLLRSACFPLKINEVTEKDVKQMLSECLTNDLLMLYGGDKYLLYLNFRQQTRSPSKFPEPTEAELLNNRKANVNQMSTQAYAESESESKADISIEEGKNIKQNCKIILEGINKITGRQYRETETNLAPIKARLEEPDVDFTEVKKMLNRQWLLWKGTPQAEFYRPVTLFAKSKFESYYAARNSEIQNEINRTSAKNRVDLGAGTKNDGVANEYAGVGEVVTGVPDAQ